MYQELKKMQNLSKTTEQQMFKENQRLNQEVSNLRYISQQKDISGVNHKYFIYDYPNDECKISRLQELFCEVFSQDFYIYI